MFRTVTIVKVSTRPCGATGRRLPVLLPMVLLLTAMAAAQDGRPPRSAARPDVSLVAAKRLEGTREFLAREQWSDALDALERLAADFSTALIEVEPGRFLNVHDVCQGTIARMPPAGLAVYRSRVDGAAEFLYEDAVQQHHPDSLRQLLHTYFASSYGDDALWWLAEDAWTRGDLDQARLCWTQLVPLSAAAAPEPPLILRYPDSGVPQYSIFARLVLCSIMQGDLVAAGSELRAFRELFPTEEGSLAGRQGLLCDILNDVLAEAGAWPAAPVIPGCQTFACRPQRNAVALSLPPVLEPLWKTSLANARVTLDDGTQPGPAPATFPVVWNSIAVIQDDSGIRALNLKDGRPAWPTERPNDRGVVYSAADTEPRSKFPAVGIARYSGTVANGRYYTRVGPPILASAAGALRPVEDRLIALDLETGEGRLKWDVTADELLNEEGWRFSGAPLAVDERLYVTVRRADLQVEIAVACLDARDGSLIWRQPVAIDLETPPEQQHRLDHELLAFSTGLLYFANQAGLLVALDAESGTLTWVASYASYPLSTAELSDPASAGLLPPVFDRGMLYLAPRDAAHVMAFDASSGVLRWKTRKPGRINALLGATENMLVAGGDRLWRLDADTGRLHPQFGYDDPAGYGSGRGAIAGTSVYWTTREELFEVDLASGLALRRLPLAMLGLSGGANLVIADDCLLFAEPDRLTVFAAR